MKNKLISGVLTASLLTAAVLPTGCGYFLHPERRGNSGGGVDGVTLIMDLLWLIPGIIPGVIALVVDFSSGAIYVGGGRRSAVVITDNGNVPVSVPASTKPMSLEFRFIREDDSVLTRKVVVIEPHAESQTIELHLAQSLRPRNNEKIYLEVSNLGVTAPAVTATR